jgi:ankyrin repeat protein
MTIETQVEELLTIMDKLCNCEIDVGEFIKNIKSYNPETLAETKDINGNTALQLLLMEPNISVEQVKDIIGENKTLLTTEDNEGSTLLHTISCNGNLELAKFLMSSNLDVKQRTKGAKTLFHMAALTTNEEYYKWLLEQELDPASLDNLGNNTLHYSVEHANLEMVLWLKENNFNLDDENATGFTPLQYAREWWFREENPEQQDKYLKIINRLLPDDKNITKNTNDVSFNNESLNDKSISMTNNNTNKSLMRSFNNENPSFQDSFASISKRRQAQINKSNINLDLTSGSVLQNKDQINLRNLGKSIMRMYNYSNTTIIGEKKTVLKELSDGLLQLFFSWGNKRPSVEELTSFGLLLNRENKEGWWNLEGEDKEIQKRCEEIIHLIKLLGETPIKSNIDTINKFGNESLHVLEESFIDISSINEDVETSFINNTEGMSDSKIEVQNQLNFDKLESSIIEMQEYSRTITGEKGSILYELSSDLSEQMKEWCGNVPTERQKSNFKFLLVSKNTEITKSRFSLLPVIANVLIALIPFVGAQAILIHLAYTGYYGSKPLFFFQKSTTTSEDHANEILSNPLISAI